MSVNDLKMSKTPRAPIIFISFSPLKCKQKCRVNCLKICRWIVSKNRVGELSCRWIVLIPDPFIHDLRTYLPMYQSYTAKSDEVAHPMELCTQYTKTVSWNCKWSVTLLQAHKETILPYTVNINSARCNDYIFAESLFFFQ